MHEQLHDDNSLRITDLSGAEEMHVLVAVLK